MLAPSAVCWLCQVSFFMFHFSMEVFPDRKQLCSNTSRRRGRFIVQLFHSYHFSKKLMILLLNYFATKFYTIFITFVQVQPTVSREKEGLLHCFPFGGYWTNFQNFIFILVKVLEGKKLQRCNSFHMGVKMHQEKKMHIGWLWKLWDFAPDQAMCFKLLF